jgi:zinc transport system substrate-binding protein
MILMNTWTTRAVTAATASAAALALAGCGTSDDAAAGGGDGLTVVAGFYPLEWAAQRVGGERLEVSSLTPPGAEAHDLELAPQDVAAVAEADLLVYLEGFQRPWTRPRPPRPPTPHGTPARPPTSR